MNLVIVAISDLSTCRLQALNPEAQYGRNPSRRVLRKLVGGSLGAATLAASDLSAVRLISFIVFSGMNAE